MISFGILDSSGNTPHHDLAVTIHGGCFQVTVSVKGQEVRLEKMTPLKSSRELLSVRQESVEPQPRGVPKKERARSPDLGPQEQMNPKEKLRPFQRSGEE